jgi:DNA-binding MarR family transcriptional regulator
MEPLPEEEAEVMDADGTSEPDPAEDDADEQVTRLVEAMRLFSVKLGSLTNNVVSHGQLNLPQYNALAALNQGGRLTMGALAQALCLSTAATTHVVDRLVHLGLVSRRRSERDRRVVWVMPTTKGRQTVEQVKHDVEAIFSRVLGQMPREDRLEFVEVYEQVTKLIWELPLEVQAS